MSDLVEDVAQLGEHFVEKRSLETQIEQFGAVSEQREKFSPARHERGSPPCG